MSIRIGYEDTDRLLTYPHVNNLSTSSSPIQIEGQAPLRRVRARRLRTYPHARVPAPWTGAETRAFAQPIHMRACQHRQPPPTLTKHSTPKVAGNSPLPISCGEIISLKFRHFQHMIEHSIIELHAKLQGAHRTTVPHSATISARASPQQLATPGHSRGATTTRPNA